LYIVLRGRWCNIIVLNVLAPTERKSDGELWQVFDHFPKYHMKIRAHTIKENAEALVVASKKTGLEVNAGKTKYMVMSRDQNAG